MYNRYSLQKGIFFVVFVILLQIPFSITYGILYVLDFSPTIEALLDNNEFMTFMLHLVIFVIPTIFFILTDIPRGKVRETLRLNKFSFKNLLFVVALTVLVMPLISLLSYSTSFFVESVSDEMLTESLKMPFIISFLSIGVMPAFTEEFVFRGILLSTCDDKRDRFYALLNGFLFGAMHGNLSQFFYAMVLGIVFYYFVKVSNSLFLAVIPHFLINGSQVLLVYLLASSTSDYATTETAPFDPVFFATLAGITVVWLIIYSVVFKKFVKYNNYTCTGFRAKKQVSISNDVDVELDALHKFNEQSNNDNLNI